MGCKVKLFQNLYAWPTYLISYLRSLSYLIIGRKKEKHTPNKLNKGTQRL